MSRQSKNTPPAASLSQDDFEALRAIVAGTATATGDDYFPALVEHLARAMGTRHAFVAKFVPPQKIRTLAFWSNGAIVPNIEYELPGTPCQDVIDGEFCFYPSGVQKKFPDTEPGIESYLGAPLRSRSGDVIGHLCVLDENPLPNDPRRLQIFEIFAARAAAELDRLTMDTSLKDLEAQLHDLFDEAPIAYVHEGLDSKFIRANKAALRILGVKPEEVDGMYGMSLIADTPEAQARVREAFAAIGRGTDQSGVVLELRRKDTGAPIWIEWWSNPAPEGHFTRTMFFDITARVLMEQEQKRLQAQNTYLQEEIKEIHNFEEIVGASKGLVAALDKVQRVAQTDATVLITGETGTGKELIARAIHSASKRADKPFIKVNVAALPESLIESELFGHERGAFSGALQRRIGRFELAHGGTIFLDEIGDVPMDIQVKLLRVLQEREFERIGSNQTIKTDVRIVAATNRNLPRAIQSGDFREDLYYRLNVFPVALPALRERPEDIPLLVKFFVQKYSPRIGRRIESIDPATIHRLLRYRWPGNIRELENLIERALILGSGTSLTLDAEMLGLGADAAAPPTTAAAPTGEPASSSGADLDSVQREHIVAMLNETAWVIEGPRGAASRLGMKPGTLRHRMKKLGISRGNAASA